MDKLNVELGYYSKSDHNSMVVTGFRMLEKQGKIKLSINNKSSLASTVHTSDMCEAIINKSIVIAYENSDGYNCSANDLNKYLKHVDFYFKRSFSEEINDKYSIGKNVYPLGMNYYCIAKNNPLKDNSLKNRVKELARFFATKGNDKPYVDFLEQCPTYKIENKPKIIFSTRLWGAHDGDGPPDEESIDKNKFFKDPEEMNKNRIEIIRESKKIYGENFIGGIYDSELARQMAPDLIINKINTIRGNYINLMKSSDICIASMGLSGSTGWKTAEYVSASKAIVSEKFIYSCPGDFSKDKNFLEFNNVNECLNNLDYLHKNPEKILKMQWDNYIYYQTYLRPDMKILNSLIFALKHMN